VLSQQVMMSRNSKGVLEVVMKTCPVCGLDVEDSYLFCPDDGAILVDIPEAGAPPPADIPAYARATKPEAGSPPSDVVVLYCGECAAEYPMTFVECPVHHSLLISYKIQTTPPARAIPAAPVAVVDQINPGEPSDHVEGLPSAGTHSTGASEPAPYPKALAAAREQRQRSSRSLAAAASDDPIRKSRSWSPSIFGVDYRGEDHVSSEPVSRFDNPGFRTLAATIVVALALFCVVVVYIFFFTGGARRQTVTRAAQPISTTPVEEPPPFVPTPAEALDYKEESAVVPASPAILDYVHPDQTKKAIATNAAASLAATAKAPPTVRPAPGSVDRVYNAPTEPAIPRPAITRETRSPRFEQASVGAKLIRVRSMRTASGVRYDLTFDLKDESGRHAQWERMQISTRAASGVSHSQAIPFVHRLGASGALTFTVSVEMRGRSEADWQGRVVCTTTGSDNDGKPLRASFGTNVTP
jgi:hypothetical protein